MTSAAPNPSEEELILAEWIRRGIIHPPLLSWAWPGASPLMLDWPVDVTRLRAHYFFDHCQWYFHWKYDQLAEEHAWLHDDPLWSNVRIERGERLHVHGTVISEQSDTGEDWEW